MRTVFVHIGLQKTGSSAFQAFLAQNADALHDRGLDVLRIGEFALGARGEISSGNGGPLARSLMAPDHEAAIRGDARHIDAFRAALAASTAPAAIVSSEMFVTGSGDDGVLTRLRALLDACGVEGRILYAMREQVSFLCAHYVQRVKRHGLTETPETFAPDAADALGFLHYDALHARLSALFGADRVRACVYEAQRTRPGGVIASLLALAGVDAAGLPQPALPINPGLTRPQLALMRRLNALAPRMRFSDQLAAQAAASGAARPYRSSEDLLPHETRAALRRRYAEGNARVARSVFGREALFPPSEDATAPYRALETERLDAEEVAEILGGLLVDMDRRLHALETRTPPA